MSNKKPMLSNRWRRINKLVKGMFNKRIDQRKSKKIKRGKMIRMSRIMLIKNLLNKLINRIL